jgi:hypothetical protein
MSIDVSRRRVLQLAVAPALLAARPRVQDLAPTVSRIYPGADGKLVYVPDEQGNTLLDASHAGYGGGGMPIPTVAVRETIWPVAGDNTEHVQAAIDKVSALPLDKYGFRGAVVLRAGYYRMAAAVTIKSSGVVLRGEGMGDTGTILVGTGTGRPVAAAPPAGAIPGGNTITIDAPITCAIEKRWGGGEVMKYDDPGRLEKVGIENLRGISEFDPTVRTSEYGNMDRPNYVTEEYYADENHYSNFITFDNIRHGWVRNATALHFVNSMVGAARGSKWITVQDCVSREPISRRMGARRFTFALRGQLALVQRCHSDKGRHSFMMGQPTASGNVFLDCHATNPYSSSEPHEQWATGGLYDNVQAPLTARFWKNIVIGWAGANTVFWNCEGSFLVQKPPTAQNYTFGHIGVDSVAFNIAFQDPTKDGGHIESLDRHVAPRSLYLTQLRERLGDAAVRNVAAASQIG